MAPEAIAVAGATRPYPGEFANGDAWCLTWHEGRCRVALIDALGHGEEAAAVAAVAEAALSAHPASDPVAGMHACHRALAGTRGAVIAIAQIDPVAASMTYVGVGNTEALLWQGGRPERPVGYRGVVGLTVRTVRPFTFALQPDWLLVLHTDGVSARFDLARLAIDRNEPQALADAILARWARPTDDATVVVAGASHVGRD